MNRRQILKTMLLAPFVRLFKLSSPKKEILLGTCPSGAAITVPKGEKWEVTRVVIEGSTFSLYGAMKEGHEKAVELWNNQQ